MPYPIKEGEGVRVGFRDFIERRIKQEQFRISMLSPLEAAEEYAHHKKNYIQPKHFEHTLLAVAQQDARYKHAFNCPFSYLVMVRS